MTFVGLKSLVQTYVGAISNGSLPCMESAVLTLAQIENSAAVQKAITHYEEQMNQKRNGIKDVLYLNKLDIEK